MRIQPPVERDSQYSVVLIMFYNEFFFVRENLEVQSLVNEFFFVRCNVPNGFGNVPESFRDFPNGFGDAPKRFLL